ncbi:4-amino-4-deoxy-L-arabinose-phosphoundecaprenol flippase subunit ArnE [Mangrovitalea sediminis]|uniref:4-amino-4-deoxy-L-arabinose-phosphoundecaprenol flippase subunit ArnE n=1 Tax=Mangrovitalea sediminis TaxID=1982043 RepID=UPI000BE5F6D0|nr:4-amino-4-deoxy-L-arabinose-phosphoundecaprenol flippase subunit ArnE [Mangrovitalea sediminis]
MSLLLVLAVSLFTCLGQLMQKQAVESWKVQPTGTLGMLTSRWLWLAIISLGTAMLIWLVVLQRLEVSVAYPMLSLNFVFVTLAAQFWFGEKTTPRHWVGILFIMLGIALLRGT